MSSLITVLANVCLISTGVCHNEVITNSDAQPNLSIQSCLMGAPQVAEWMKDKPQYRLHNWSCVIGKQDRKDI